MEKISLSQIRKDYMYLYENIDEYFVDDDALVNKVSLQLIKGEISLKDYLLWNIEDIVYYVSTSQNKEDIQFLEEDKRANRIIKRYNIEI